jgi:hypothetical protein
MLYGNRVDIQILEDERDRRGDFELLLRRCGYQATRVSENPYFDKVPESTHSKIREKGVNLLIAILNFFSATLDYLSKPFVGIPLALFTC